jgi:flagellin-specific chaperone FliS
MNAVSAMKQYQQVSVHSGIMDASPHRLVQMLMEGPWKKLPWQKEIWQTIKLIDLPIGCRCGYALCG